MNHPVRNSDPETGQESSAQVGEPAANCIQILDLARDAGADGLSSNETERLIPAHKNNSVSPRFAELVKSGKLVRVRIGTTKKGRAISTKHFDPVTQRNVIVNFCLSLLPLRR